jgi:hypothetical protein
MILDHHHLVLSTLVPSPSPCLQQAQNYDFNALFAWLISHQPAVLFSQNEPATSNQPTVLFSQNKPAPAISHQPTEQAVRPKIPRQCLQVEGHSKLKASNNREACS